MGIEGARSMRVRGNGARSVAARVLAGLLLAGALGGRAAADEPPKPLPPPIVRPGKRVPVPPPPGGALPGDAPAPAEPRHADDAGPPERPRDGGPPERPEAPGGTDAEGPRPRPPPPRPAGSPQPAPGDFVFEVERPGGLVHTFDEGPDVAVYVMVGNPRLHATAYVRKDGTSVPEVSVGANTIVLWVDRTRVSSLEAFQGLGLGGRAEEEAPAKDEEGEKGPSRPGPSPAATLFQEAVLGLYAEGAAELRFGDLRFRADRLYLDPRTYRGLLVEPRLTAHVSGRDLIPGQRLPVYLRARRARLVGEGVTVFDDADLTTSPAEDRIELRVRRVTVEEYVEEEERAAAEDEPKLLGYRSFGTQRMRVESVVTRAERVPLFYWPSAVLGPAGQESFPVRIRQGRVGRRSSLGWYATLGVGGDLGPEDDPFGEWTVILSGYTKRGPAGGPVLSWNRGGHAGRLLLWGVHDRLREDRNDFVADDSFRWRALFENRWTVAKDLTFDAEFAAFSDAGVNREFFEREHHEHKDYETYGRLLWTPGNAAATLVGKAHVRDFVSETTEEPQAALWLASVPVLEPAVRGGFALDVTSVSRAGRLARRWADGVGFSDYEAIRLATDTLLHAAGDAGPVRLSAWAGPSAAVYYERTDGGPDTTRAALLAGARADLQMWKTYSARGGPFALDGLRHVVDVDLSYGGRFHDTRDPEEVPFFDRLEEEDDVSAVVLRLRNRLQTHDRGESLRPVLDLEVAAKLYPQGENPYGQETPAELEFVLRSQPRPGYLVGGEGTFDFERGGFREGWVGAGVRPTPDLAAFGGIRWVHEAYFAPVLDLSWRWSEKYGLRFFEAYDFRGDENTMRLLFRRYSPDHVIEFGFSLRGTDDAGLELSFAPAIGGRPPAWTAFREEPDLDPWRAFPGTAP